jgi:SAM-dependent methyltransferase
LGHLLKIDNDYIYICANCGLGVTVGKPFDISNTLVGQTDDSLISQKLRQMLMSYEFGFLDVKTKLKVFEIGAGKGDLSNYLVSLGHDVTCSDVDYSYRKKIKERFNTKVVEYDLIKNNNVVETEYDVVVLRHVFEHVDDPILALKNIKRLLKPFGKVLILSPNLNSWAMYVAKEKWTWNLPEHRYHWTDKSLKLLMEANGFEVIEMRGIFSPFGLPLCLGKNIKTPLLRKLLFPFTFLVGIALEFFAIPFKKTNNILAIGSKKDPN